MDMNELLAGVRAAAADAATAAVNTALANHGIKPKAVARSDSNDDDTDKDKKSDADDGDDKDKKSDAYIALANDNVDLRKQLATMNAQIGELVKSQPRQMDDTEARAMSDAQAACDQVAQAFGDSAPRPLQGETLVGYRKRLVQKFQKHSAQYKAIDLSTVNDPAMLAIVEKQVYADAMDAANAPGEVGTDLREIVRTDTTGRKISTFVGHPSAWTNQFKAPRLQLLRINKQGAM